MKSSSRRSARRSPSPVRTIRSTTTRTPGSTRRRAAAISRRARFSRARWRSRCGWTGNGSRLRMKRIAALGTIVAAGALTVAVAAQQQPPQPSVDNLTVEKAKDNLWVIRGGGGNTAVFATANGLTVVDTKNPGWGQPLIEKIKTFSDKPITRVINTHTHYDHVSGNIAMPAAVEIVAHENTAK